MTKHIFPVKTFVIVCVVLLLLTLTTLEVATFDLGPLNTVIALGIAACKASLIILYFMHLRYSSRLTPIVIAAGLLWLGILIVGIMDDMVTRGWLNVPGK
jgi:cytochrome c oxidase subunit IV